MARKLRLQYPGAIYHVMNRGDRREAIVEDDEDRECLLDTLTEACEKTAWEIHACCLSSFPWSSYPQYLAGPGQRPAWLRVDRLLNPDALTIGFARRFATYKRAPLVFQRYDEIVKLVKDPQRPIQFIFAGKAHPHDDEGKRFIQHIIHLSKHSELKGHLIFLRGVRTKYFHLTVIAGVAGWPSHDGPKAQAAVPGGDLPRDESWRSA